MDGRNGEAGEADDASAPKAMNLGTSARNEGVFNYGSRNHVICIPCLPDCCGRIDIPLIVDRLLLLCRTADGGLLFTLGISIIYRRCHHFPASSPGVQPLFLGHH